MMMVRMIGKDYQPHPFPQYTLLPEGEKLSVDPTEVQLRHVVFMTEAFDSLSSCHNVVETLGCMCVCLLGVLGELAVAAGGGGAPLKFFGGRHCHVQMMMTDPCPSPCVTTSDQLLRRDGIKAHIPHLQDLPG